MPLLNWQGSHCLFLWHGRLPGCRAARRRGPGSPRGDPQLHQKIDPSLDLKVVELTSGVNANELLASGDVDANYFQHVPYLKDQEKALGKTFAVAATVHIEPLGIYSHKHKDFSSLPENATVAVPNNTTNLSRALFLLQAQKLIKLDPKFTDPATTTATPKGYCREPETPEDSEIESPQILRSLDDVDRR